jgi:hypothetical protein
MCQEASLAWQGHVSEDAWLLIFTSPDSVGELQRWDQTVNTNWGEKKGQKVQNKNKKQKVEWKKIHNFLNDLLS